MAAKLKVDQLETVDGTGNVTLNNSVTMASGKTLPAASLTGSLPAGMGGKVLQVVSTGSISRTTTSSTGGWYEHYSLSITPSATSSKILICVTQPTRVVGSTPIRMGYRVERGTTNIWNTVEAQEHIQVRNAADEVDMTFSMMHLDTPSTTSATTYSLSGSMSTGTSFYMWESGWGSNMILMEIAG